MKLCLPGWATQLEKRPSGSLCSGLRRRESSDSAGGSRLVGQREQAGVYAGTGPVVKERGEAGFGRARAEGGRVHWGTCPLATTPRGVNRLASCQVACKRGHGQGTFQSGAPSPPSLARTAGDSPSDPARREKQVNAGQRRSASHRA
jgi:hypothetical protein